MFELNFKAKAISATKNSKDKFQSIGKELAHEFIEKGAKELLRRAEEMANI